MSLRYGLHARLITVILVATVITLVVVGLILQRQGAMQREMLAHSRGSMHALVHTRLAEQGRATVERVAESLVNPLYYFDLEAIGQILATIRRQPDVSYVVVYTPTGDVLHDGSPDIMSFGQAMDDPFAAAALAARAPVVQSDEDVLDIAVPIALGGERLGGLRVGYSLRNVAADEEAANEILSRSLEEISGRHLQGVALSLAALVTLGVLLSLLAQRALVRPIRQLAGYAREIEAGNFNVDVADSRRRDEIGDLVRAFRRMSESVRRHDRDVRRMAYTDALTGLSNRLAFREVLDQRLIESGGAARALALLFADIDDFKRVNDTLGHDAGDEVLVQFSERIRDTVQRFGGGATLSRFGGDEFVILLEGDERAGHLRETASLLAGVLVEELARPIMVRGRPVHLGISVGITLFPDDASGATSLMKNGDIAMYQAKVAGKNCYRFYSRAMDQAVERRVRLQQHRRGAWPRGELARPYHPGSALAPTRLVGAEVLLRWQHPAHGMVAPSVFIEVAEQGGLIETIGPQVLRTACRDAVRWRDECGQPDGLFLAVNVSPRQLRGGDFAAQVEEILADTGHPPALLHLELTETAVIGDELRVSGLLGRLRGRGVKVWLDDFGTGFSGLSHLRRVPIDGVKIDRSFIAEASRNPDDLALTTAIIAMAHSLGMTVVAEGVETEAQADLLRERGCDFAQGYWLGHPMPLEELIALCR